ncbi:MAG TPA: hypothetical protein VF328_24435 [Mycobacterium sp.]
MTVVLALRCADGVVLASDSQITDPGRGLSYPAQKLHSLGSHAAWGGSGSRAVLHDIERLFDAEPDAVVEASDVGRALQARVLPSSSTITPTSLPTCRSPSLARRLLPMCRRRVMPAASRSSWT